MTFPSTPGLFASRDLRLPELGQPESLLRTYAWMQLARTADNRILDLFRQGLIKGTVTGGQGNESLIVPLALLAALAIAAYALWSEWSLAAEQDTGPDWDHATVGTL